MDKTAMEPSAVIAAAAAAANALQNAEAEPGAKTAAKPATTATATAAAPAKQGVLAIRKCKLLKRPAVFYDFEDGEQFLTDDASDKYRVFATAEDALVYINADRGDGKGTSTGKETAASASASASVDDQPLHIYATDSDTADTKMPANPTGSLFKKRTLAEIDAVHVNGNLSLPPVLLNRLKEHAAAKAAAAAAPKPEPKEELPKSKPGPKPFGGKTFEDMFAQLQEFKVQKGHADVPFNSSNRALAAWVRAIRKCYNDEFIKGEQSEYLTDERIQLLTGMGFNFTPRKMSSFEENAMKWLEYKTENGKDPPVNTALGNWVRYTRKAYKAMLTTPLPPIGAKRKRGRPGGLTLEWLERLSTWGFEWEKKPAKRRQAVDRKSWEERFEELLEYKRRYGNTLVPQKYPVLGTWVHGQRTEFKRFNDGVKSRITTDKIEKLKAIGFVFHSRHNMKLQSETITADEYEGGGDRKRAATTRRFNRRMPIGTHPGNGNRENSDTDSVESYSKAETHGTGPNGTFAPWDKYTPE